MGNNADMLQTVFTLLVLYQVKQFIADFPLQREYMLRKVSPDWDFIFPLLAHCSVHFIGSLSILMLFAPQLWWLALVDFVTHFTMDRIKAGPRYLGRFNDKSKPGFWNALGFDQMVHHFTHYFIIYRVIQHIYFQ